MTRSISSLWFTLALLGLVWSGPAVAAPFAYITNSGTNDVSVIDTATNVVTVTVPVGIGPFGVAVNPAGTRVYVGNSSGNDLSIMDALNARTKKPRAYTTYMTVMQRLDDKGLLDRTRSGRSDTYTPTLSREEYQELRAAAQVQGLVDEFGDVALAHFAKSLQTLDPARRRQLRRLAGQL